jgi:threonine aldolase
LGDRGYSPARATTDTQSPTFSTLFSEAFETDVGVMLVSTGTASNALALASMCPPYGAIFCRRDSHIEFEEGGAVEHLAGGCKLVLIDGVDGKLDAPRLDSAIASYSPAAVFFRPAAVSITQLSELGTVYSTAEIRAIAEVAHRHGLKLHIDGARFANAVAAQGCTLADMSWKAGVDVLSFGATKNGAMAAEAIVYFDKSLMRGAAELRKRASMLWSKHRFLAVQWEAYLANGLWLQLAQTANDRAQSLARQLPEFRGVSLAYPADAKEIFLRMPVATIDRLEARGFQFYRYGIDLIRLVTGFSASAESVEVLPSELRGADT